MFEAVAQWLQQRRQNKAEAVKQQVSFCDSCGEVCTADCRVSGIVRQNEAFKESNFTTIFH